MRWRDVGAVFTAFARLGLTSFGGPTAHIGFFRAEFVDRRGWLDEVLFADLVALCHALPGPASSQLGIAIGRHRAGWLGGLAAWTAFTLPSAAIMLALALAAGGPGAVVPPAALTALKAVAAAVVANALIDMTRTLCPDWPRRAMAVAATAVLVAAPGQLTQLGVLIVAGAIGATLLARPAEAAAGRRAGGGGMGLPVLWAAVFVALLAGLPLVRGAVDMPLVDVLDGFYRVGALVFGGGHVVLPMLKAEPVVAGVTPDLFLAGYGAAQALPGPLFTFAAYLGALAGPAEAPWLGGVVAVGAIFLPSFLLLAAALPAWHRLRAARGVRAVLDGVNAGVVGLLAAALYDPVLTSAVTGWVSVAVIAVAFAALRWGRVPPWLVVLAAAALGAFVPVF